MILNDYQCQGCKRIESFENETFDVIFDLCLDCSTITEWRRQWSFHTGRGSSGEPAR